MGLLETIETAVFALAQLVFTVQLLQAARRRTSRYARLFGRVAIVILNVIVITAYPLTFSEVVSRYRLPPATLMIGAVILCYLGLITAFVATQILFRLLSRQLPASTDPGRRRSLEAAARVVMAAPAAVLAYGTFIERRNYQVEEIDLPISGLASSLDGLRVLHLSDIHLSAFLSEREFASVIDASNELRPNLAVVTGDLISTHGDPLDACLRQLARIKSEAGVFGCMGNHERYAQAEDYTAEAAARLGVRFLRGQAQALKFRGEVLNLAGVDYQRRVPIAEYIPGAGQLVVPGASNVLLSHNPNVLPRAAGLGYHLVLAGHTHGGQVAIEILDDSLNPARYYTRYVHGMYRSGATALYVTRGIGTITIPVRFGAPPEISLLRLRSA